MIAAPLRLYCRLSAGGGHFRRWSSTSCFFHNLQPHLMSRIKQTYSGIVRSVPLEALQTIGVKPRRHLSANASPKPSQCATSATPRTFQLCEFDYFHADAHHFLFIQRESNSHALETLQQNLRHATSRPHRRVRFHPRVYTDDDLVNIQKSCLDILDRFAHTSDVVTYQVLTGRIHVDPHSSARTPEDEAEWLERVVSCAKVPEWGRLGGKLMDLEKERYEPCDQPSDVK